MVNYTKRYGLCMCVYLALYALQRKYKTLLRSNLLNSSAFDPMEHWKPKKSNKFVNWISSRQLIYEEPAIHKHYIFYIPFGLYKIQLQMLEISCSKYTTYTIIYKRPPGSGPECAFCLEQTMHSIQIILNLSQSRLALSYALQHLLPYRPPPPPQGQLSGTNIFIAIFICLTSGWQFQVFLNDSTVYCSIAGRCRQCQFFAVAVASFLFQIAGAHIIPLKMQQSFRRPSKSFSFLS